MRAADRPTPEPAPPEAGGWLRRLLPFLMAHKRNVFIAFGVSILGQAVAALTPVAEKIIVDYHDLPVVVDAEEALAPAARLLVERLLRELVLVAPAGNAAAAAGGNGSG